MINLKKSVDSYPEKIAEIHNEFNTAGDNLLAEAERIIDRNLVDKAERLQKSGFVESIEVKKAAHMMVSKELADNVMKYAIRYPNNKFIMEHQVRSICAKYGLKCAPLTRYKGFVPANKLSEIESFSVKSSDIPSNVVRISRAWGDGLPFISFFGIGAAVLRRKMGSEFIEVDDARLYWFNRPTKLFQADGAYVERYRIYNKSERLICAPAKDLNLSGLSKLGSMLLSSASITIPDPVVLQPVKGGFLIIAAWGDEASDEMVVNQKMN